MAPFVECAALPPPHSEAVEAGLMTVALPVPKEARPFAEIFIYPAAHTIMKAFLAREIDVENALHTLHSLLTKDFHRQLYHTLSRIFFVSDGREVRR